MTYMKGVRASNEGNASLLKQYGGGKSGGKHADGGKCYASGGAVKSGNPSLGEGLSAAGGPSKPSLARPGRKMPGKSAGKGKTNINVVVMSPKGGDDKPMPPMADAGGPPMMPPGAGGPPGAPPMPMRASGGRVKREDGGSTISKDSKEEAAKLRDSSGSKAKSALFSAGSAAATALANRIPGGGKIARGIGHGLTGINAGFAVDSIRNSRKDAAEADRIEKGQAKDGEEDRKSGGKVCRAPGGPVGGLSNSQGGAGGGMGRLAKIKKYGK